MAHQFPSQVIEVGDRLANFNTEMITEFKKYMADVHGCDVTLWAVPKSDDSQCVEVGNCEVVLHKYDPNKKISIIKCIRSYKNWGLKYTKDLVEETDVDKPQVLAVNLSEISAKLLKQELMENGATEVSIIGMNSVATKVRLTGVMPNFKERILGIKIIRSFTGLGLKESMEMMDQVEAGKEQTVTTDFPEDVVKQLTACNIVCNISR